MISEQKHLRLIMAGLLLSILMASMDNTIVATAMYTIVSELNGLDQFVWVTSAYMVTTMAGMPIFGKLSDMYGRKRFFLIGISIFMIGSILCGTASSIVELSLYRAIQGVGGGALMPIAFTIIFDIFPPERRGKVTGLFGAVFGTSSILGPLLGAVITDAISWRWIFLINIPIGLLALALIALFYKERAIHQKQRIDWGGAVTLVITVVSLMFALELGGKTYAWNSLPIIGLFTTFTLFFFLFLFIERKAVEPIISFSLFKNRLFSATQGIAFFYGSIFVIGTIFIPIYVQGVYGGSATNAGIILMPMMLAAVTASQVAGFLSTKTSYRNIMMGSIVLVIIGVSTLSTLNSDVPRWLLTLYMIAFGAGIGFSFSLLNLATVHHVEPRQRGSATSTNSFFRSLGMTLGITIFGIIQSTTLTNDLQRIVPNFNSGDSLDPRVLVDSTVASDMPTFVVIAIRDSLAHSISTTFMFALIPTLFALICIILMTNDRLRRAKTNEVKQKQEEVPVH